MTTSAKPTASTIPVVTFADVMKAVEEAPDLTDKMRCNLKTAVRRGSALVSSRGLSQVVSVQLIAKKLESMTPAKMGFASPNAFSALQSNLRRALRLAGVDVMPGRHQVPVRYPWSALAERCQAVEDSFLWTALSRFVHWLSDNGIEPGDVASSMLDRFAHDLRTICLNSKAEKVLRNTAKAWTKAQVEVPGWPDVPLSHARRAPSCPLLPWSAFPPSLEADMRRFLARGIDLNADDWPSNDNSKAPLRLTTALNYENGFRRVASILVAHGVTSEQIEVLKDLVLPDRVKLVLKEVAQRTRRQTGGHVMFLAMLLFTAARDHVGAAGDDLAKLKGYFKTTKPRRIGMSQRTVDRFIQFDDDSRLNDLILLPRRLMALADAATRQDASSAKFARVALYLAVLWETGARSGNVVGLNLDTHIIMSGKGRTAKAVINIPGHEVKNGQDIMAELSPTTTAMLCHYRDKYRPLHCSRPTAWLFPRADGTHWSTNQACQDLKDLTARHVGADVTPHLIRSLAGKLVLDANPGDIATVQQLLGHKTMDTTRRFYVHLNPQRARRAYAGILEGRGR